MLKLRQIYDWIKAKFPYYQVHTNYTIYMFIIIFILYYQV